ncbi:Putative uncharacterized protein [Propionibacterium freudenreichii]|nr:Putative uncharacterized protein [Propionibacterium freudenreichii]
MANRNLNSARWGANDEYYTVWASVEREMNTYLEYDPDVFRGKVILLPCDDPEWSNFTKFFALHFTDFGLKKLISTSYAPNSNAGAAFYTPTLFETEDPGYDEDKSLERGRVFTLTPEDVSGDGRVDIDDLKWAYLDGDGDFRSAEVTALRNEADMVITNPPTGQGHARPRLGCALRDLPPQVLQDGRDRRRSPGAARRPGREEPQGHLRVLARRQGRHSSA